MSLDTTTNDIWPENARRILSEKNIDVNELLISYKYILFPWYSGYNLNRTYFSLRIQQRPLFIIKPVNTEEIEKILNYVNDKNLTVRAANGKHSSALTQSEVLLDMSFNKNIEIKDNKLIVGAGLNQGEANKYLFEHETSNMYSHFGCPTHPKVTPNDIYPGGSANSVGVAGVTTSGGVGVLVRLLGLTIDSTLSFKITLPPTDKNPARTIIADENNHNNIFWSLCGGGGNNFGVVSEITYKVIQVNNIKKYNIVWKWKKARKVLKNYRTNSINRPNNYNEDLNLYHNPVTKKLHIELSGIYIIPTNQTQEDSDKAIRKELKELGGELTISDVMEYDDLYRQLVRDRSYLNFSIIQPLFIKTYSSRKILKHMQLVALLPEIAGISITLLGGAVKNVSSKNTAFYPRNSNFFLDIYSKWDGIQNSFVMEEWTNNCLKSFLKEEDTYLYVGFPVTFSDIKYTPEIYYGKNLKRLKEIKHKCDPLNILTPCGTL